jgi:hypothetical protein
VVVVLTSSMGGWYKRAVEVEVVVVVVVVGAVVVLTSSMGGWHKRELDSDWHDTTPSVSAWNPKKNLFGLPHPNKKVWHTEPGRAWASTAPVRQLRACAFNTAEVDSAREHRVEEGSVGLIRALLDDAVCDRARCEGTSGFVSRRCV